MYSGRKFVPKGGAPRLASKLNVLESAAAAGEFNTFGRAVAAAGLTEVLSSPGPFTVFAPTDAAFDALPDGTLDWLLRAENRDELVSLLSYHVMTGRKTAAEIGHWDAARTVQGQSTAITMELGQVSLDGAPVRPAVTESCNGYLHGLEKVIFPPNDDTAQ